MEESKVSGRARAARVIQRITAWALTLFYVFFVLPSFLHLEAYLLHTGCLLLLGVLWLTRQPVGFQFSLRGLLIGSTLVGMIVGGYFQVDLRAKALHLEVAELRTQRLGDNLRTACTSPERGDKKERDRLVAIVRERKPGWARAICALTRRAATHEHENCADQNRVIWCGTPYMSLLGFDSLGYAKDSLQLEKHVTREAEQRRAEFLAELGTPSATVLP